MRLSTLSETCYVCGVEIIGHKRLTTYVCSPLCEAWLIDQHRSLLYRDLATVMQGKRIKMRGEQVLAWRG